MDDSSPAPSDLQERATAFALHLSDRYRAYHDHKESMAYAAITLYIAAFTSALISDKWPPDWGRSTRVLAVLAITGVWFLFLSFVKWQLRRRRWSAIRIAGLERVLASWVPHPPSTDDLARWSGQERNRPSFWVTIVDHIWPLRRAVPPVDVSQEVYPRALVLAWLKQARERGTSAIFHERLVVVAGWAIYLALLARTLASSR